MVRLALFMQLSDDFGVYLFIVGTLSDAIFRSFSAGPIAGCHVEQIPPSPQPCALHPTFESACLCTWHCIVIHRQISHIVHLLFFLLLFLSSLSLGLCHVRALAPILYRPVIALRRLAEIAVFHQRDVSRLRALGCAAVAQACFVVDDPAWHTDGCVHCKHE
jgi:hypothetical protein